MRLKNSNFLKVPFRQDGFTLTEVLVAASIIGILAVAAVGSYFTMRPTSNMHSYGRDLIAAAQGARLEAVKRNACVGIIFDLPNNGYRVFLDDGLGGGTACDALMHNDEQNNPQFPARLVGVPEGVSIAAAPVPPNAYDPVLFTGDKNFRGAADHDFFSSISFNARSLVAARTFVGNPVVFRNDPVNPTWWGRVVVNNFGGSMAYQTNNNPANEANWSE